MTWDRARDAVRLMALDPKGMGGLWLRARPGPARDAVMAALSTLDPRKIAPNIPDEALQGGVDLAATLSSGALVHRRGVLERGGLLILSMAERAEVALAARLGQALDRSRIALIAVDEASDGEDALASALADRMGLFVSLDDITLADATPLSAVLPEGSRARYQSVRLDDTSLHDLVFTAAALGIDSLRAPLLAARAACGLAALAGSDRVTPDHLRRAVELTLAHRGTPPEKTDEQPAPPQPDTSPETPADPDENQKTADDIPAELLVEAALAALPTDLLRQLAAGQISRARNTSRGSGAALRGNRRGRPLAARRGRLDGTTRLDIPATLRAAAPWQKVRAAGGGPTRMLHLRGSDIHVKRFEQKSDRLLIFTVDASGSQAMTRLGEAKGAIELLLAQAYARRDHVSLIAFRGTEAELLLPPTRSLVQTKRRLAALPGGGGTPLAAGLNAAGDVARLARARGFTPSIALLTDGRANIDLQGRADRAQAGQDAIASAIRLTADCPGGIVIDTGRRPAPELAELAGAMRAVYLALPRADANGMQRAIAPLLAD